MLSRLQAAWSIVQEVRRLPRVTIHLGDGPEAQALRRANMAAHPKFPLIGRKQLGACLIDLEEFKDFDDYLARVNGRESAGDLRRKRRIALRCGYSVRAFTPQEHAIEIKQINRSTPKRQGRQMSTDYLSDSFTLPCSPTQTPYGVFSCEGNLVGYVALQELGEVANLDMILGHADHLKNGIMHFLVTEIVALLMQKKKQARYVYYDMWYGGSEGLRTFKKRCGFKPYLVSWR